MKGGHSNHVHDTLYVNTMDQMVLMTRPGCHLHKVAVWLVAIFTFVIIFALGQRAAGASSSSSGSSRCISLGALVLGTPLQPGLRAFAVQLEMINCLQTV